MNLTLGKLPWYAQVGAFVGVAVASVVVFYFFYASPARDAMAGRQRELDRLKETIAKGRATERQLPQFRAQVAELEARLESLRAVLPEQKEYGDLLRRLQTLAVQSNLTIRSFKPQPMVTKQLHAEWPVTLQLDGTYHNLALFFDRLGKFSRIFNVSGLVVKGKDKPEPNSTITAECVATTFVLLEAPAKGTPGKPGAKPGAPAARPAGGAKRS